MAKMGVEEDKVSGRSLVLHSLKKLGLASVAADTATDLKKDSRLSEAQRGFYGKER